MLDWELSTIGHPFADLAHLMIMSTFFIQPGPRAGNLPPTGIDEHQFTELYSEKQGLPHPVPHWPFFKALACFRSASISQVIIHMIYTCLSYVCHVLMTSCHMMIIGCVCKGCDGQC